MAKCIFQDRLIKILTEAVSTYFRVASNADAELKKAVKAEKKGKKG